MHYKVIIGLFIVALTVSSCKNDCLKCTGITADQNICPDDFNEKSDFENYVSEYRENGGTCD